MVFQINSSGTANQKASIQKLGQMADALNNRCKKQEHKRLHCFDKREKGQHLWGQFQTPSMPFLNSILHLLSWMATFLNSKSTAFHGFNRMTSPLSLSSQGIRLSVQAVTSFSRRRRVRNYCLGSHKIDSQIFCEGFTEADQFAVDSLHCWPAHILHCFAQNGLNFALDLASHKKWLCH